MPGARPGWESQSPRRQLRKASLVNAWGSLLLGLGVMGDYGNFCATLTALRTIGQDRLSPFMAVATARQPWRTLACCGAQLVTALNIVFMTRCDRTNASPEGPNITRASQSGR